MVASERLARFELDHVTTAVLAAVRIAREEERVRDVSAEPTGNVNEPREADDGGARNREPLRANDALMIGLDNLGFAIDHQPQGALHRNHGQWLERSVEREAA